MIQLAFSMGASSTIPILCCKEIRVTPKIRVFELPSVTLSQTMDSENFRTIHEIIATCHHLSLAKVEACCDNYQPLSVELSGQYLQWLTFD